MTDQNALNHELQQRLAQLEQERQLWESERERLIADFAEQAEHISEAWQRLESERRIEMQSKANSAARAATQSTTQVPQVVNVLPVEPSRTTPPQTPVQTSTPTSPNTPSPQPNPGNNPSLADQFRTLQREVHAAAVRNDH